MAAVNPEKAWTKVKAVSNKAKTSPPNGSYPAPIKIPRPEREKRIIFRRRVGNTPQSRNVATEILYRINKVLQSKRVLAHMRFIKLGYNTARNLIGLVSENATASMLVPVYTDLLLRTALKMDKDIKAVVEDLGWVALKLHTVEIERYHHKRQDGLK